MSLFITTDAVGGVWSYSLALARGLAEQGEGCTLAVLGPAPDDARLAEATAIAGCTVWQTGLKLEWTVSDGVSLDRLIRSLISVAQHARASTAHLHAPALASLAWPMPVVAVAHSCMATWWDTVRGVQRPAEIAWHARATSAGLDRADISVAPSHAFAAQLRATYGPQLPIDVVHNGLPPAVSTSGARGNHVLVAGRLWDESKNVGVLDRAAVALHTIPIRAAGPCAAPGGEPARFDHLQLLGNLSSAELRTAMTQAAIFASPAIYEPFGLAVLEAAGLATPLVLADIPSFRELWTDAALFVPPRDATAWAGALEALIHDGKERDRLGRAAALRARDYTQTRMVAATMARHRRLRPQSRDAA